MVYIFITMLFSVFTPLLLFISVAGIFSSPKKWRQYVGILVLTIFVIVYCYQPIEQNDLYRYFQQITFFKKLTLQQAQLYAADGLFVKNFFFWICAQIDAIHLVPAISTASVYGITIYITCDTAENYEVQKSIPFILLLQFCMLPFVSIINNVRNIFAYALVILAVYLDIVKHKRRLIHLLLYILPCFIHPTAIILVGIRITLRISARLKFVALTVILLLPSMIELFYERILNYFIPQRIGVIIYTLIRNAYGYLHDTSEWSIAVQNSLTQQISRLLNISIAILMLALILLCNKNLKEHSKQNIMIIDFLFALCILTVACFWFVGTAHWRFSAACFIIGSVLFVPIFATRKSGSVFKQLIVMITPFFMTIGLALQVWGIRNEIVEWVQRLCVTNIYTILFDIFTGILNALL